MCWLWVLPRGVEILWSEGSVSLPRVLMMGLPMRRCCYDLPRDGVRRRCLGASLAAAVAALVLLVLLAAPVAAQGADPYPDAPADAWYAQAVGALAEDGVFAGTGCDAGFCPDDAMDRATMAVWLVRVLDDAAPAPVASTRFADVEADHRHSAFIERFAELGVTSGCRDGTVFCPDGTVTRAQMAVFLARAFDLPDGPDPDFDDVAPDAWYATDVAKLAASGITSGCGDGTVFCPDGTVTRAEMAVFLARALGLVESPDSEPPATTEDSEDEALGHDYVIDYVIDDLTSLQAQHWRNRARGEQRVKIHVCAERGFEHLFSPSYLTAYADAANEQIAPFYAWQSSGLLNVRFEPGQIVTTDILVDTKHYWDWASPIAPRDCFTGTSNSGQLGDVHHYLLYGEDYHVGPIGGRASLGGYRSSTYMGATRLRLKTLEHELDHNLGVPHINDWELGRNRLIASEVQRPITVGTLAGYPDIPRLMAPLVDEAGNSLFDEAGDSRKGYWVFPCYILVRLGWPMGDEHPACSRFHPTAVRDIAAQADPDGTVSVTWKPPSSRLNPEPVTGYEIELWLSGSDELSNAELIRTSRVGSGTTSLALPSLEFNVPYEVTVRATSAAGLGDRLSPPFAVRYYGPAGQIRVADRSNTEWATYELSWDPVPGASYYAVSGFENCTYTDRPGSLAFCFASAETASITLSEWSNQLVSGRSYEISVFACGEGFAETRPEWPNVGECFAYGTTNISAQTPELETVRFTPLHNWYESGTEPVPENAAGLVYTAEWAPHPDATSYGAQAFCDGDEGARGSWNLSVSDTSVTANFALEFGKHCRVDIHIDWGCPPFHSGICALYARGWVTVPARSS